MADVKFFPQSHFKLNLRSCFKLCHQIHFVGPSNIGSKLDWCQICVGNGWTGQV